MLSPMTPPGTLVVCINNGPIPLPNGKIYDASNLVVGQVYTLDKIIKSKPRGTYIAALLVEVSPTEKGVIGFKLDRFKPAVLPKCLTELLTTAPVKEDA